MMTRMLWLLLAAPVPSSSLEPEVSKAIARGVEILLDLQESLDGATPEEWPYEGVYRVREGERRVIPIGYRIGGTAICAWSLLEVPGWDESVERRKAVGRALDFILAGLEHDRMSADFRGRYDVRGWGHTYALQFLCRLVELERVPPERKTAVRRALRLLVQALEKTEIPGSGGWNYSRRGGAKSSSPASTFMTAPAIQALFRARALGVPVDRGVLERALAVLEEGRLNESGAFQYATRRPQTGEGFEAVPGAIARMAVCETTLLLAGRGKITRLRTALDAFFEHWEWLEKRRKQHGTHVPPYMIAPYYFYFGHYYCAQAIEFLPAAERADYRARLYALLFEVREKSGGWNDRVFPRSENFGTAMAILALLEPQLPRPARGSRREMW